MRGTYDHQKLQTALSLHQNGKLNEAADLYRQLINENPNDFYTLHFLGVIEAGNGNLEQAKLLMARSVSIQPPNIQFMENYATVLYQMGDYYSALQISQTGIKLDNENASLLYVSAISFFKLHKMQESITQFDKLLLLRPQHVVALNERGAVLAAMRQYDAALASIDKALALNVNYAEAQLNKGNVFSEQGRYDEAIAAYDNALALDSNIANAWLGRGNVFVALKRYDETFAAYDKALALKPDLENAWLGRGNVFFCLKRFDEALAVYDKALAFKPDLEGAWLGRGNVFFDLKRYDEAFVAYDKALSIKPDLAEAYLGRGNVLVDLKRYDEALAAYDKALTLKPDLENAWLGRGNVFGGLTRYDEANAAYDKALLLKPDLAGAEGVRLLNKMRLCDWRNFGAECAHLISSVRQKKNNTPPFEFLAISSSAEDQFQSAKLWIAEKYPPYPKPIWQGERYNHDRIRVAYLSGDFHQHPVSFLMAGMFECHDSSHFETIAISVGPDDNSQIRQRLQVSFEHFIDAEKNSDEKIGNLIKELEVDILVDLAGLTAGSRTSILARRSAPMQVSYLGYLGTMGAEYMDYIIADKIVIPTSDRQFYSEKIVHLPNTFQPTDRHRPISDRNFTRSEVGLPQVGFVFCCFNGTYKITPDVYDIWMRIIKKVEGSVLWLFVENSTAKDRLKNEASERGVNPERLIFAPSIPLPEHQARLRLADLFLDTLPYNAGATASDTLWAGIPVLTCIGDTFIGRMAASVLNAIRLPELITTTIEAYEQVAIDLAKNPEKMVAIKVKLAENRLTTPLFDTALYTKHIEAAYTSMYERHQAGLAPDHIAIPH